MLLENSVLRPLRAWRNLKAVGPDPNSVWWKHYKLRSDRGADYISSILTRCGYMKVALFRIAPDLAFTAMLRLFLMPRRWLMKLPLGVPVTLATVLAVWFGIPSWRSEVIFAAGALVFAVYGMCGILMTMVWMDAHASEEPLGCAWLDSRPTLKRAGYCFFAPVVGVFLVFIGILAFAFSVGDWLQALPQKHCVEIPAPN